MPDQDSFLQYQMDRVADGEHLNMGKPREGEPRMRQYGILAPNILCPVCGNETIEGEYVDNGVGNMKCSPDFCDSCGWAELGLMEDEKFTIDQQKKMWELQVTPYDILRGE